MPGSDQSVQQDRNDRKEAPKDCESLAIPAKFASGFESLKLFFTNPLLFILG